MPSSPFDPTALVPQSQPPDTSGMPPAIDQQILDVLSGASSRGRVDRYADDKALLKLFEEKKKDAFDQRWVYERSWWRNLLYLLGRHWIYWDVSRGQWMDKRMAKWIPRPVTNKIAEVQETILSVFEAVNLGASVRPQGQRPEDMTTAEIADRLEPAIADEHDMKLTMRLADFWMIATGNVFLSPWWDKTAETSYVLPRFYECATCLAVSSSSELMAARGLCPRCQTPNPDAQSMSVLGQIGRGRTDVCSPWEILVPPGYGEFPLMPYVIRQRWRTKAWYESAHPDLAKTLRFSTSTTDRSLALLKSLAAQSDVGTNPMAMLGSASEQSEGIAEYELSLKPCREYPDGLFLRVAGDTTPTIVRDATQGLPGPLPYTTTDGNPLFTWVHIPYERFGGRIWGRSPHDRIIHKNDQLNQTDSLVQLIIQRMSNPVWLEPKGSEVKKFTGEPGLVVKYNPLLAAGNAKPERIEGSNVPHSVIAWRQQQLIDIETLSGTTDALKGARPAGVEAFSAMQLLVERAQSRFAMVLSERGMGYRQWYKIALEIERAYGPEERFFAVMGPNGTWQNQIFKQSDLTGSVQVIVEDGSQAPKTNLGKRASIQQLQQMGIVNPKDPDQAYTILKIYGETELMPVLDLDVKSALQEQDAFERWSQSAESMMAAQQQGMMSQAYATVADPTTGQPMQAPPMETPFVRKPWQNDPVHLSEHRKWALSDTATQLFAQRPELEAPFAAHLAEHETQAMLQSTGMPRFGGAVPMLPGPGQEPGHGPGAGQALSNSTRESGNPADVKEVAQGTENIPRA